MLLPLLSLIYLSLPYFLFAVGWLNSTLAGTFALLLLFALFASYRNLRGIARQSSPEATYSLVTVLLLGSVGLGWTIVGGSGGVGPQTWDWRKHNAILYDLTERSWPVTYSSAEGGAEAKLVYYLGYYLPAAAVGKVWGLRAAHWALFGWTVAGVWLALAWIVRLAGSAPWSGLAFVLLSGLDFLGAMITGKPLVLSGQTLELWAPYAQLNSNMTLLVWVPQHALASWLSTALVLWSVDRHGTLANVAFYGALGSLWSPFVVLGLAPLLVVASVRLRGHGWASFQNLVAGPAIVGVVALYLCSLSTGEIPRSCCFGRLGWSGGLQYLFWFSLLEFGLFALLAGLIRSDNRNPGEQTWWPQPVWQLSS